MLATEMCNWTHVVSKRLQFDLNQHQCNRAQRLTVPRRPVPKGYYFDPHVGSRGKCEPCSVLCHRHTITGNTKQCKTKCAGFLEQGVGKTSKTRTDCPKGFYFDPHVGVKGKCEPCSVLCYAHKVTRDTEDCKSKCPGFLEQALGKTRTDCSKGFYFDPHVGVKGKCEPCSVLCYAHKVTRKTEDCKSKCPGFLEQALGKTRTDCSKGFYFDPHVGVKGKCEPCSVLCYAHKVTRNTEDCKSKCPDEFASKETGANQTGDPVNATEQVGALDSNGEVSKKGKESRQLDKAVVSSGDKTEGNNNDLSIIIGCLVGVICVVSIASGVGFVIVLKKVQNRRTEPVKDEEKNAQTGKLLDGPPVQESMTKCETTVLVQSDDTQVKMAHGEVRESFRCSHLHPSQS
ncbi:laminin subunit alpha-like [Gigantopelta aegis]|uniref:laminin subunit alpha-like n=1 Tax=Gigantopelta aegis TaxID=1735272 RepID=UPI001B88D7BE|nr:laminin subunit alpha-like [Gigantopelta aegis]